MTIRRTVTVVTVTTDDTVSTADEGGDSLKTVLVAFVANVLIAIAKTVAALLTGSASMVAESAHSWADSGNEIFLLIAEKRSGKKADDAHPLGYGKEAYVWSMFAAVGLLTAGAVVSIGHGIQQLGSREAAGDYLINYIVLAIAFVLEGSSFLQALRQTRGVASKAGLHPLRYITRTSDPTLRAVFFEDAAAQVGLLIAAAGVALHQLTGNAMWDALGSILVGVMLAVVAVFLVNRNREFLVGEAITGRVREGVLQALIDNEAIERVTYLHLEFVGPQKLFVVASVDLVGDERESVLAVRLQEVEDKVRRHAMIEHAVLSLSLPQEQALVPGSDAPGNPPR